MSAVLEAEPITKTPSHVPAEQHLLLYGNWELYQRFLAMRRDFHLGMRINYDRGRLELMTVSSIHERLKILMSQILFVVTEELSISSCGYGHTTVGRVDLDRGCEPDVWYYFGDRARQMRGLPQIDFNRDPPPDLAIEIEHTRTFVNRLGILAAMSVPEVWRFDGTSLRILQLQTDGTYAERPQSRFLPMLAPIVVLRVLEDAEREEDLVLFRNFRQWVRENLVPPASSSTPAVP